MKIGVVADTQDNYAGFKQLLDRFLVGGAQWLLHCGGLGAVRMVELLKPWQFYIVAGQHEPNRYAIETALRQAHLQHSLPAELRVVLDGRRVGLCRGQDMSLVNQWAKSGELDYIFYGHALRRQDQRIGKTRIICPGTLGGPRYQTRSGDLIDLVTDEAKLIEIPG
jgi:predicted phosphodiesterase